MPSEEFEDRTTGATTSVPSRAIEDALDGMDFPARKERLVRRARERGADAAVVAAFERLPDREYEGAPDVIQAYGDVKRRPREETAAAEGAREPGGETTAERAANEGAGGDRAP